MSIATKHNEVIASNLIGLDNPSPGTFPTCLSEAATQVDITPAPLDFSFLTFQAKNLRWFPKNGHDTSEQFLQFIQHIQTILKTLLPLYSADKCSAISGELKLSFSFLERLLEPEKGQIQCRS
jgi:hypothetical protein